MIAICNSQVAIIIFYNAVQLVYCIGNCLTKENEMAHEEKLYKKCVQIYEADGQHAVMEYCNKIGHKTWGKCKPCESDHSPIMDDNFMTCLVCGHSTYHD